MTFDPEYPPDVPGIHAPDWGRYRVHEKQFAPVGDPMRWGAETTTRIPLDNNIRWGEQIIAAATLDRYSRPWSVLGTLTMPAKVWANAQTCQVCIECVQGVGQVQLLHRIVLVDQTMQAGALVKRGLCHDQFYPNGGPYTHNEWPPADPTDASPDQSRAFAAVGALIGKTIGIRAYHLFGPEGIGGTFITARLSLIVTPYAAGEQL